jgi:hypothetical protein
MSRLSFAGLTLAGLFVVAVLAGAAPAPPQAPPDPRDNGPDHIDVSSYPQDQQKKYEYYSAKCNKCHPLARSVNAKYNATEWKRYMKRMLRRPNSGINEEQAALIYDFLKFHATQMGY